MSIRFEDGPWPLWRLDKDARYAVKSLLHSRRPQSEGDAEHFARCFEFLRDRRSPQPEDGRRLRLGAIGDLMWIPGDWRRPYSRRVEGLLGGFDVLFANLETPTVPDNPVPSRTLLRFNAPLEYLRALSVGQGETVVSLCNNHALDQGIEGLSRTRQEVSRVPRLHPVGGLRETEAWTTLHVGDWKVAVLASSYGVNPWYSDATSEARLLGVPRMQFGNPKRPPPWPELEAMIARARGTGADLVVFQPHWGFEYEYWPSELQREHAYRLVELGVDVIVGSSPHVLQPLEVLSVDGWDPSCPVQLRRGGPPRAAVVAYSLGNFTSCMPTLACNTGAVLGVDLLLGANGRVDVRDIEANVTVSARDAQGRKRTVLCEELDASASRAHAEHASGVLGVIAKATTSEKKREHAEYH